MFEFNINANLVISLNRQKESLRYNKYELFNQNVFIVSGLLLSMSLQKLKGNSHQNSLFLIDLR